MSTPTGGNKHSSQGAGQGVRQGRLDTTIGWGISLAIHCVILLALTAVTWPSRGTVNGNESFADIIAEDQGGNVELGQSEPQPIRIASEQLTVSDLPVNAAELQETTELVEEALVETPKSVPELELDTLIGMESSAPSKAEKTSDSWDSLVAGGGTSARGTASFFGLQVRGSRFVYVVDYSASMSGGKLQAAKVELIRSVNALSRNMQFYIIFYDHKFQAMPTNRLARATIGNKRKFLEWAAQIGGGGSTDPTDAMMHALALKPDAVWLLSDGRFSANAGDAIRQANPRARIQVHTIGFHKNADEELLKRIARENRGKYRFVPSPPTRSPQGIR